MRPWNAANSFLFGRSACGRMSISAGFGSIKFSTTAKTLSKRSLYRRADRLIVETYLGHLPGRKAVAFCVNVRHGEDLAELFRRSGVAARSVSGRMPRAERERHLAAFRDGELRVLCACDILNEGWDCPDVEVLLMARPTLSKVIYMQQIGRGTRKAAGKECLVVVDFVDNGSRYNQSLNLHRVLGSEKYLPGGFVLASAELMQADEDAIGAGSDRQP